MGEGVGELAVRSVCCIPFHSFTGPCSPCLVPWAVEGWDGQLIQSELIPAAFRAFPALPRPARAATRGASTRVTRGSTPRPYKQLAMYETSQPNAFLEKYLWHATAMK